MDLDSDRFSTVLGTGRGNGDARSESVPLALGRRAVAQKRWFQAIEALHDLRSEPAQTLHGHAVGVAAETVVAAWELDGWEVAVACGTVARFCGHLAADDDKVLHVTREMLWGHNNIVGPDIPLVCGRSLPAGGWFWSGANRWHGADPEFSRCETCETFAHHVPELRARPARCDRMPPRALSRVREQVAGQLAAGGTAPVLEAAAHDASRYVLAGRITDLVLADVDAAVFSAFRHTKGSPQLGWQLDAALLTSELAGLVLPERPRARGSRAVRVKTRKAAVAALMRARV